MLESDEECECTMTEEEIRIYEDQVSKSDGFDVSPVRGNPGDVYLIQPSNISKSQDFELYSQLAVDEYNRRFKEENRVLAFVKVLKAMGEQSTAFICYVTFEAKDVGDGGKIKIYQAVVFDGPLKDDIKVVSFRLKPEDHEQGSDNHGKEWFWKHQHLFHEVEA